MLCFSPLRRSKINCVISWGERVFLFSPRFKKKKKMATLWRFINLCKIGCFVRRPVKLKTKKEEGIGEEHIK